MKRALITGITGQDGAYLAQFLLDKGYEVHGTYRRTSLPNDGRLKALRYHNKPLVESCILHCVDITDPLAVVSVVSTVQPDEIYNLAAQSDVGISFNTPLYTAHANALGPLHFLEAIRILHMQDTVKLYQASTSELFGNGSQHMLTEESPFQPESPYAVAKLYGYWITVQYRRSYGIFACNGILFNHESPLRGELFVTRKIIKAVAQRHHGNTSVLYLGNLDAQRDWGYAPDYVHAMWLLIQHTTPLDIVIATGHSCSVRQFVTHAYQEIGIPIAWHGDGAHEVGVHAATGDIIVQVNPALYRPNDVHFLLGDPSKAREVLGWQPTVMMHDLIALMVREEIHVSCPPIGHHQNPLLSCDVSL